MRIGPARTRFTRLVARLIVEAQHQGFEPRLAEALRRPELQGVFVARGYSHPRSLHFDGLAVDLLLFRRGHWLTRTEHYRALGQWWERQSRRCRWGGRFQDGNHFSFTPDRIRQ